MSYQQSVPVPGSLSAGFAVVQLEVTHKAVYTDSVSASPFWDTTRVEPWCLLQDMGLFSLFDVL